MHSEPPRWNFTFVATDLSEPVNQFFMMEPEVISNSSGPIKCLLIDPSSFTPAYNDALDKGLTDNGVRTSWAARTARTNEVDPFNPGNIVVEFYRETENLNLPSSLRLLVKGIAHICGLAAVLRRVRKSSFDVVHFQWAPLPLLDSVFIYIIRRNCPVVFTAHDTTPYNGGKLSVFQLFGFDLPMKLASHVITHTMSGREKLIARGISSSKISVVKHGPLALKSGIDKNFIVKDGRYTVVLFGQIKPYKGVQILLSALVGMTDSERAKLRVVIAGAAHMPMDSIYNFISTNSLSSCVEVIDRRLAEDEVNALFSVADAFVFPYTEIDASGVFYLVSSLDKWLIASRVGVFAEEIVDGINGNIFDPGDYSALGRLISESAAYRPHVRDSSSQRDWNSIGGTTKAIYEKLIKA